MSMKRNLTLTLAVIAAVAAPGAFATNGYFSHGYSVKEKGLAGAGVAMPLLITVSALLWLSVLAQPEALVGNDLFSQFAEFEKLDRGSVHASREAVTRRQTEIRRMGRPFGIEGGI